MQDCSIFQLVSTHTNSTTYTLAVHQFQEEE